MKKITQKLQSGIEAQSTKPKLLKDWDGLIYGDLLQANYISIYQQQQQQ